MLALAFLLMRDDAAVAENGNDSAASVQADAPGADIADAPVSVEEETPVADLECPDYSGPNDPRKSFGDIQNELTSAVVSLQGSGQPEHWLAAAILLASEDTPTAMALLQRLLAIDATAQLAAFQLLRLCDDRNRTECYAQDIEDAIIDADKDNAAMWIQMASLRLNAGREQDAIDALRQAIHAPRLANYFGAQIDVLDRGLAAVTGWTYSERVIYGADAVISKPFDLSAIRGFCRLSDAAGWREVCDAVGERVVAEGGDLSVRIQGAELRLSLDENRDSPELMAVISEERDRLNAMRSSLFSDAGHLNLILNDETVMRAFIEAYDVDGEEGAMLTLEERASQLRASPDYDQCNFVSNPFIRVSPLD